MTGPQTIGRYEIIEELGRGAMGSVFRARDPAVGRDVALKTIHSQALAGAQSDEYRARFYREARASGVLAHPGIVPVFDVGEHEGAPFLVMEFVSGRTLAEAIKKGERYTLDRVCEIGQQLAEALGYAHRQGVVHRDIKPANILMTSREVYGSERPRITDFGIAKLTASEITTTGQMLGTPSYMPPEQFTGAPIDGRADLFSLGVLLYCLSTGEQPFPGETMTAVSYKVVYTEPVPPAKLNPAVPAWLEGVILKCLAKSPSDRYQTGEDLAQDLAAKRMNAGAAAMESAVPLVAASARDADATLAPTAASKSHPPGPIPAPAPTASRPGSGQPGASPGASTPAAAKRPARPVRFATIFAVALLAAAAIGAVAARGWFLYLHRSHSAAQQKQAAITPPPQAAAAPQPDVAPATTEPATQTSSPAPGTDEKQTPAHAQTTPAVMPSPAKPSAAKPSATKPSPINTGPAKPAVVAPTPPSPTPTQANAAAAKPVTPPTSAATASPHPLSGAFDPRKLDPNKNAKLKIELSKFPNGLAFSVEMGKQPYVQFVTGDGSSLDDLYVPPGIQQFRVTLKSGGQEIPSNIESSDFKAKKKKTLKIQLMEQGNAASKITLPISKDAQLFLSFSTPLF